MRIAMILETFDRVVIQLDGQSDADLRLMSAALKSASGPRGLRVIGPYVHRLSGEPLVVGAVIGAVAEEARAAGRVLEASGVRIVTAGGGVRAHSRAASSEELTSRA